jgi:Ca2+-binding EF-hand superfamily protein
LEFVTKIRRNDFLTINSGRNLRLSGEKAKAADVLSDMLWSDPIQFPLQPYASKMGIQATGEQFNVFRNLGSLFGYDITSKFLAKNGFDFMIRSHEVRSHGFSVDHDKCYTLFSASKYGRNENNGSILMLDYNAQMFTRYEYITDRKKSPESLNEMRNNLKSFKQLLEDDKKDYLLKFEKLDKKNTGTISIRQWSKALKEIIEELEPKQLVNIKEYLGVFFESNQTIKYESLFQSLNATREQHNFIYQDVFKFIDSDKNDLLSSNEVKNALESLSSQYPQLKKKSNESAQKFEQFLKSMDNDNDENIDLNEFKDYLCLPNL